MYVTHCSHNSFTFLVALSYLRSTNSPSALGPAISKHVAIYNIFSTPLWPPTWESQELVIVRTTSCYSHPRRGCLKNPKQKSKQATLMRTPTRLEAHTAISRYHPSFSILFTGPACGPAPVLGRTALSFRAWTGPLAGSHSTIGLQEKQKADGNKKIEYLTPGPNIKIVW